MEHPITGEEVLGYVGETVRIPFARLMEHMDIQPWIDTVTRWERDPRVFAGKQAVLDAEAAAIRAEKPLYNVRGNETNRDRIIPPDAIRQRRARDAAANAARWVHPDDRTPAAVRIPRVQALKPRRRWKSWQKRLVGWPSVWLAQTIALWAVFGYFHLFTPVLTAVKVAGVGSAALILWVMCGAPIPIGRWRRRARRVRKTLW
ncbi:hypothetical protein ACWKSP_26640 [Micromonosporaceae bacterium Da 78-11]